MSTDPAQVRMDTIREQAAEFDEYDARMKTPLTTTGKRPSPNCVACGSSDLAQIWAPTNQSRCADCNADQPVDAAREDLAAKNAELSEALAEALKQMKLIGDAGEAAIARVTAERDQARARIAELEAEQQNGIWSTHVGHISRYGHFLPNPENPTHECRVWYGPVTLISDTTGDQQ